LTACRASGKIGALWNKMEKSIKSDRDLPHEEKNSGKRPSLLMIPTGRAKKTEEHKIG
jgi:hypothetical protein